jgi:SAM-dependent methyltransferase
MVGVTAVTSAVVWHDVECGAYAADLPLWRELAEERPGPVLDLGCGAGRVALDLAEQGHDVTGLDCDPELVRELAGRAREAGLRVRTEVGDVRSFALGRRFSLVLAPMQVVQLLGGPGGRAAMLRAARAHLEAGGLLAVALADPFEAVAAEDALPPLPDVRESGGWVFSSTPVAVRPDGEGTIAIERLRQAVSPAGELSESSAVVRLDQVPTDELEAEARSQGFSPLPRRHVESTRDHVGSDVVRLEAP